MIEDLLLINMPVNSKISADIIEDNIFFLKTCQRILLLGLDISIPSFVKSMKADLVSGEKAYQYLLEIICGLRGQIIAENEIGHQFKQALSEYLKKRQRNSNLIKILEKAQKDAKEIRTIYLKGVGQQSYAGIAKRIIRNRLCEGPILILGSGSLCHSLVKVLKKNYQLTASARSQELLQKIRQDHSINIISFLELISYQKFPCIINSIGTDKILLNDEFFNLWLQNTPSNRLLIDFGQPSPIKTSLGPSNNVFRLADIFKESTQMNKKKQQKINMAKKAINQLAKKRNTFFQSKYPILRNKRSQHFGRAEQSI